IPLRCCRVLESAGPAHARVVDEHVELSEAALRGSNGALPVALARDVELDEHGFATLGADPGRHRRAFGFEDVADDDPRAFLREEPRLDGAHPARATADQSNLAREPHRCLPPRSDVPPLSCHRLPRQRPTPPAAQAWTILPP